MGSGVCVADWLSSVVGCDAGWVLGGAGRASPASTGDEVACGAGVELVPAEGAGRVSAVVRGADRFSGSGVSRIDRS